MGTALVAGAAVSGMFYILRGLRADLYGQLEEANDPEEQRRGRLDARVGPAAPRPELRLLHAQVVFRHGARVPFFDLPPRAVWDEADAAAKQAATARLCGGGGLAPIRLLDMKRGELPLDSIRARGGGVGARPRPPGARRARGAAVGRQRRGARVAHGARAGAGLWARASTRSTCTAGSPRTGRAGRATRCASGASAASSWTTRMRRRR